MTMTITATDAAAVAAACKFAEKPRRGAWSNPYKTSVRIRLDACGLRVQATDGFRAFGYRRPAGNHDAAELDVFIDARQLCEAARGLKNGGTVEVDGGTVTIRPNAVGGVCCGTMLASVDVTRRPDLMPCLRSSRGDGDGSGHVLVDASYLAEAAAALKAVYGKSARVHVDAAGGVRGILSLVAGDGDSRAAVCTMPVFDEGLRHPFWTAFGDEA